MPRILAATVGVLVVLAVGSQLVVPPLAEHRLADRIERNGGHADVSLGAFPAVRLLAGHGDRVRVRGEGIRLEPGDVGERPLESLDHFGEVDVRLRGVQAGPIAVRRLDVDRDRGGDPYRVRATGSASPLELGRFLGGRAGRLAGQEALGSLIGGLLAGTLPGGGRIDVPLGVDAVVASADGRVEVERASGTIAGLPTGPIAGLLLGALAWQLSGR